MIKICTVCCVKASKNFGSLLYIPVHVSSKSVSVTLQKHTQAYREFKRCKNENFTEDIFYILAQNLRLSVYARTTLPRQL